MSASCWAGYAGDAAGVAALEEGQEVRFACHLYTGGCTQDEDGFLDDRGEECDDVTTAVNGYHLLAKDGQVNQGMVDNNGTDVNSRTVIGITADGKVEILCANKPGANFSSELTSGTTFKEITEYMMEELDCVDVLNMDGGGSTEMTARRAGSDELETVSYPSDGGSRLVSNSLLIVSSARRTAPGWGPGPGGIRTPRFIWAPARTSPSVLLIPAAACFPARAGA